MKFSTFQQPYIIFEEKIVAKHLFYSFWILVRRKNWSNRIFRVFSKNLWNFGFSVVRISLTSKFFLSKIISGSENGSKPSLESFNVANVGHFSLFHRKIWIKTRRDRKRFWHPWKLWFLAYFYCSTLAPLYIALKWFLRGNDFLPKFKSAFFNFEKSQSRIHFYPSFFFKWKFRVLDTFCTFSEKIWTTRSKFRNIWKRTPPNPLY